MARPVPRRPGRRRACATVAIPLAVLLCVGPAPGRAGAGSPPSFRARPLSPFAVVAAPCGVGPYRPPLAGRVVDGFRLPAGPYGPGNRGLEYRPVPGTTARAIGAGVVTFAGAVAGERFVTVLHPDGLSSSYSYLANILVEQGALVSAGTPVGTTGWRFQLGIRRDGVYLDPAPLLGPPLRLRLVGPAVGPGTGCGPTVTAGRGAG